MSPVVARQAPAADMALLAPGVDTTIRGVSARTVQRAMALAIVPVGASAVWLAATSEHLAHPAATALYRAT